MNDPVHILGLTIEELLAVALARGVKTPRATEAYRAAFREGRVLRPWTTIEEYPIVDSHVEGDTIKFVQRHADGLETESV